jgi:signal transduction histidine kinase/CheY-like chemotaxis protein
MDIILAILLTPEAVGHAAIPRQMACCEVTVNLPSFAATANAQGNELESIFIVDDLTRHPDLKNRPYVTEFPNGRYYCGAPITTPQGVNIGAYCILDDKPGKGISERDITFMRDMSQTVMTHMETMRALSEREQNNQMVAGLGDFVRNAPDIQTKSDSQHGALAATNMPLNNKNGDRDTSRKVAYSLPEALVDNAITPRPETPNSLRESYFDHELGEQQQSPQYSPPGALSPMLECAPHSKLHAPMHQSQRPSLGRRHSRRSAWELPKAVGGTTETQTPSKPGPALDDRSTYQRAAEIMCQSLRIDGVAFLDMTVGTFGGLVQSADTTTEDSSMNSDSGQEHAIPNPVKARACSVLGCAETVVDDHVVDPSAHQPAKMLTESFVRRLLNRHPGGRIWTFGENLLTHDEDGFSTDSEAVDVDTFLRPQTPTTKDRKSSRRQRRNDGESLQRAFPGARCIALHGIWDHARRRWNVAGLYWTFDPLRVLSPETEMHFVAAFSDIVVAETNRLDVVISDKAKSDFISSVSHELRSPLHGILGSVEILKGENLDNTTSTLAEQIDSCGHSLLDIIDHLLEFSDLRNQNLSKGAVKSSKIGRKFLPSAADISENHISAMKTGVALDDLTEDAVVSTVYSFFYDNDAADRIQTSVVLDIERSDDVAWRCQLATGGWKRVVINLVTNALKYTPAGYVRVSLRRKLKPGSRRRFDAVLSVVDSGKGMSQEFQKNHLFQDFSQEDTLSNGLGLGLHMVSRMVIAMGGTVDVTSDQEGSGTRISVTVPLEHNPDFKVPGDKGSAPLFKSLAGKVKVGMVTVDQSVPSTRKERLTATAWSMAVASIEKNVNFLGLQAERCALRDGDSYDVKVVLDIDLEACIQALRDDGSDIGYREFAPMLVVCHNSPSAQKMRRSWAEDDLSAKVAVDFIALPCGVKQIARAVTYIRKLYEDLNDASPDLQSQEKAMVNEPARGEVTLLNVTARDQSPEQLPMDHQSDEEKSERTDPHSSLPAATFEMSSPEYQPPGVKTLTNLPKSRAGTLRRPPGKRLVADPPIPTMTPVADGSGPVLLLVDDNRINLQLLVAFAKKHKYRHIAALDGKIALDAFKQSHRRSLESPAAGEATVEIPTVILMDINMPGMDGYEAVQRIRAYESKHHMTPAKIIAVTALQSEAAQTEAFGSGFNMFLSKPIKLKSLAKIIQDG